jgi:hypothetical protein
VISPIYRLQVSYRLSIAFLALTLLSLICIVILPWSGWIKAMWIGSTLVYCYQLLRCYVFRKDQKALIHFCMKSPDVWQLTSHLPSRQMARLSTKTLCTRHVVILHFHVLHAGATKPSYLLFILSDSLQDQAFKSLRRQLRMLG